MPKSLKVSAVVLAVALYAQSLAIGDLVPQIGEVSVGLNVVGMENNLPTHAASSATALTGVVVPSVHRLAPAHQLRPGPAPLTLQRLAILPPRGTDADHQALRTGSRAVLLRATSPSLERGSTGAHATGSPIRPASLAAELGVSLTDTPLVPPTADHAGQGHATTPSKAGLTTNSRHGENVTPLDPKYADVIRERYRLYVQRRQGRKADAS